MHHARSLTRAGMATTFTSGGSQGMAPAAEEGEEGMASPAQQQEEAPSIAGVSDDDGGGQSEGAGVATTTTTTTTTTTKRALAAQESEQEAGGKKRARGNLNRGGIAVLRATATATVVVVDDEEEEEEEGTQQCGMTTTTTTAAATAVTVPAQPPTAQPTPTLHPRLHSLLQSLLGPGPLPLPLPPSGGPLAHPRLPKLFVVDLDFTLWRGNVSDHLPPFELTAHADRVLCRRRPSPFFRPGPGQQQQQQQQHSPQHEGTAASVHFGLFHEARAVLEGLQSLGVPLAIASRAPDRHAAETVLSLLGIRGWFAHAQIYHDATKKTHLGAILRATGLPPHSVLFFDDEPRNVKDVRALGCSAVLVQRDEGLSWRALEEGLKRFKQAGASRGLMASYFSVAKAGGGGKKA